MAYARYPQLRNYKKRCEIETKIEALKNQRSAYEEDNDTKWDAAFNRGASDAELDDIEAAYNQYVDKINVEIETLRRLNPVYWTFQGILGLLALSTCFLVPALVCKILGGC